MRLFSAPAKCAFPLLLVLAGCGGDSEKACTSIGCQMVQDSTSSSDSSTSNAGSDQSAMVGNPSTGVNLGLDPIDSSEDDEVCREVVFRSEASPVNVHILVDRSASMLDPVDPSDPNSPTRWDAITSGLRAFVSSDQVAGAQVGMQFFGLRSTDEYDCNVENYRVPAVPLGPIEDNRQLLLTTIANERPGTYTPTAPAVEGALSYALQIAQSEQGGGRPTVLVLATDGLPSQCGPLDDLGLPIISFAAINESLTKYSQPELNAVGEPLVPAILTYVVGTDDLGSNAASMARAGGGQAFLVGAGAGQEFEAEFLDALLTIVLKPLDCQMPVPQTAPDTGEVLDYEKIRVQYRGASTGRPIEFPRTENVSTCGRNQAWYYDNSAAPETIFFCPSACEALGAGDLKLELGCSPKLLLR